MINADLANSAIQALRISPYENINDFFHQGFSLTRDDILPDYDISLSPWVDMLCDWWEDPEVEIIWLIQGSQTGKTTFMMGCFLYAAQYIHGAVPCMWTWPDEREAKKFISKRLSQLLESSQKEVFKSKKWAWQSFRVFNAMVKVGYSGSIGSLRQDAIRFNFGDECGIWLVSPGYVIKRTRTFKGKRKSLFGTTPPYEAEHESWKMAINGNWFQWHVPCPKCNGFQYLRFHNIKFDEARKKRDLDGFWDMSW